MIFKQHFLKNIVMEPAVFGYDAQRIQPNEPVMLKINIKDAQLFRIEERSVDFWSASFDRLDKIYEPGSELPMPSPLPYDNIVISFSDNVLFWFTQVHYGNNFVIHHSGILTPSDYPHYRKKRAFSRSAYSFLLTGNTKLGLCRIDYEVDEDLIEARNPDGVTVTEAQWRDETYKAYYLLYRFTELLSCKNIKEGVEEEYLRGRNNLKTKNKGVVYKYLLLEKVGEKRGGKGDKKGADQYTRRIHLCRGHMREYTDKAPMFGKLIGKFWIPPHARGDEGSGMVVKDYGVKQ